MWRVWLERFSIEYRTKTSSCFRYTSRSTSPKSPLELDRPAIRTGMPFNSISLGIGRPETAADTRFFDLRESGYDGPVDQDGRKVTSGRAVEIVAAMRRR